MSDCILQTRSITKQYGSFAAVDHIDLTVHPGDIYGLVGKNGAGKTTLLKMASGLSLPTSGELELFGQMSQGGLNAARSRTGCIIETPNFFPYLSAEKNLEYYRIQRGIAGKDCIRESLKFVGLADTGSKKFKNFSLGMKQRLGLALAIMGNPDLLILDEPINGLDPTGIAEFREIILKLNREKGTTILISSHILGELSQIATVYGFINSGRLVETVTAANLIEKCKRRLVVKVSDTNRASAILQNELSCSNFEVMNNGTIQLGEFLDTPELVNQELVKHGVLVSELRPAGLNLENYFLDLIGGEHHA